MSFNIHDLIEGIVAFNQNGASHLAYMFSQNWWFVVIAISAIATMVMQMLEEAESSVQERQDIM